jgi:hypothetical protein
LTWVRIPSCGPIPHASARHYLWWMTWPNEPEVAS